MVNLFCFLLGLPLFFPLLSLAAKTNQKETLFSRFVLTHDGYIHLHLTAPAVIQLAQNPSNQGFSHGHRAMNMAMTYAQLQTVLLPNLGKANFTFATTIVSA